MDINFVNLTAENLADEHLSCIIRSKKPHPGVEAKRLWLSDRLKEGHVFRKLNVKAPVLLNTHLLKQPGFPLMGITIIIYTACGFPAVTTGKVTEKC